MFTIPVLHCNRLSEYSQNSKKTQTYKSHVQKVFLETCYKSSIASPKQNFLSEKDTSSKHNQKVLTQRKNQMSIQI
jgi:hypothetical protein